MERRRHLEHRQTPGNKLQDQSSGARMPVMNPGWLWNKSQSTAMIDVGQRPAAPVENSFEQYCRTMSSELVLACRHPETALTIEICTSLILVRDYARPLSCFVDRC